MRTTIHPNSYLAQNYPYYLSNIGDQYQRAVEEYKQRRDYQTGLVQLEKDLLIAVDQAAEKLGLERWQMRRAIEERSISDPVVVSSWLASHALISFRVSMEHESEKMLFKIDEQLPAAAKVSDTFERIDFESYTITYYLPIPVGQKIFERINQIRLNAPAVQCSDKGVAVTFGKEHRGWMRPNEWLKNIVYQAVYIDGYEELKPIIDQLNSAPAPETGSLQ